MDRKILGQRIREERMRIGLTQEQIAEYIDVSTTYIGLVQLSLLKEGMLYILGYRRKRTPEQACL